MDSVTLAGAGVSLGAAFGAAAANGLGCF